MTLFQKVLSPFFLSSIFLVSFSSAVAFRDNFKVVLDAGHGGKDPGNMGNGFQEKEIALDVVLRIRSILESKDIEVILTREHDNFVELRDRADIANKTKADMFISVHCNAHNSDASGPETYVLGLHANKANFNIAKKENSVIFLEEDHDKKYGGFDPNNPEYSIGITLQQEQNLYESIHLADLVQKNITVTSKMTRKDRSVRQAGFWVLHNTVMPSILIELGFLTNKKEGSYLNSRKGKKEMAEKISKAILEYLVQRHHQKKTSDKQATTLDPQLSHSINNADINKSFPVSESIKPSKNVVPDIKYRVQIASYKEDKPLDAPEFRGLKGLIKEKKEAEVQYFFCETEDLSIANQCRDFVKKMGFSLAYVVKSYDIPGLNIAVRVNKGTENKETQPYGTEHKENPPKKHTIETNKSSDKSFAEKSQNQKRTYYGVQFLATKKEPNKGARLFRDLDNIKILKFGGMYKYIYGRATNYEEAQKNKEYLESKGYKGCFIVTIDEADR